MKAPKLYAPKPRESAIEAKVVKWARDNGWLCYKFVSPGQRSVPDRMFISPYGRVVFIEFKRPGGKATVLQASEIEKIRQHMVPVEVFDTPDEAIAWLKGLLWR